MKTLSETGRSSLVEMCSDLLYNLAAEECVHTKPSRVRKLYGRNKSVLIKIGKKPWGNSIDPQEDPRNV